MISIAVCDDDLSFGLSLEERIVSYGKEKNIELETEVFSDGESFIREVENGGQYDIVYMDIEMEKKDGISAVRELKKFLPDILVIYTTSYETYFREMFETEPFRYLKKPVEEISFREYLCQAIERIGQKLIYFSYTSRHCTCRIPLRDILYFESRRRQICLHTFKGEAVFYQRLDSIEKSLEGAVVPFIRIHQSYLVNLYHISRYYPDRIELEGGEVLPVSEARQREVKQRYHAFLRQL